MINTYFVIDDIDYKDREIAIFMSGWLNLSTWSRIVICIIFGLGLIFSSFKLFILNFRKVFINYVFGRN